MSDNDNNVTRHMDDAEKAMTDAERALAAQIAEDQRAVAPWLNVDTPHAAAAVARVQRRLAAELATSYRTGVALSPRRRAIRIGAWAAAAATAAAVLLAIVLWQTSNNPAATGDNTGTIVVIPPAPSTDFDDPLVALLIAPLPGDGETDSLELLTALAGEPDIQSTLDAQFLAALLDS